MRLYVLFTLFYAITLSRLVAQSNSVEEGFSSVIHLDPISISTSTGEKPQSKVWTYNGDHWAVLPNSTGTYIWKLEGKKWINALKLSSRTTTKADCKIIDNVVHILLYQGPSSQFATVEYDFSNKTYKLWSKRTSTVGLSFEKGIETATIDMDSQDRMWVASAGVSDINVRWSDFPYNKWSAPIAINTNVLDDDICAIIALPQTKQIGVLWSNQNTRRFGFKTHTDGADPSDWSEDEVPASQSALNIGKGMADDHLNMALGSDGSLYCAVKSSYDVQGSPRILLLLRRPSGVWDDAYTVSSTGTRPIVVLNEDIGKFRVIYTSKEYGGDILYSESSTSSINFGSSLTLIKGGTFDNSTSTKANFNSEGVVLASSSTQAVGVLVVDNITASPPLVPSAPALALPSDGAKDVVLPAALSWVGSEGASAYQVQLASTSDFTTPLLDETTLENYLHVQGLSSSSFYHWRVRAMGEGGTGDWSVTWDFRTIDQASTADPLVGLWKMDEGSGGKLVDASSLGNHGATVGSPTWEAGIAGQALRLDGSSQYATIPDHTSLDLTGPMTLAAWIRPERVATQYVLKKSTLGGIDGYELSLSNQGRVFFRFNQFSSGDTYRLNSASVYPTDGSTWLHVAATYDGTVMRIYINGEENSSKTLVSPPPVKANSLSLAIGAQSNGGSKFKGGVDEVRLYNEALNSEQIRSIASINPTLYTTSIPALRANQVYNELEEDILIYPNPFTTKAHLYFKLHVYETFEIELYSSKMQKIQVIKQGKFMADGLHHEIIDGSQLPSGLYIIKLRTQNKVVSHKIILSK